MTITKVPPILMPDGYPYRKYLPTAYDSSLTIYEELTTIRAFLSEVVNSQNDVINKFNELIKWFFDKGLEDTVIKVLQQWLKDGVFDEIMAKVVEELQMIRELVEPIQYGKDRVYVTKHRELNTNYYLTHIKFDDMYCKTDEEVPEKMKISHGYANDQFNSVGGETCREFHVRKENTVTVNASVWDTNEKIIGNQIQDGVILQDKPHQALWSLTLDKTGKFYSYPPSYTAQKLVDEENVEQCWTGFYPLIMDGLPVDPKTWDYSKEDTLRKSNRNVIAQYSNGNIVILTCEGRTALNVGFNYADLVSILTKLGVHFAYNLDGGGSTATNVRNYQLNRPYDGRGKIDRKQADFIYIRKPHDNKNLGLIPEDINELKKLIDDNYANLYNLSDIRTDLFNQYMDKDQQFGGIQWYLGDVLNTKLVINKDMFSFVKYDDQGQNGLSFFNVNKETGVIQTSQGRIGEFMGGTKLVDDANTINVNGEYRTTSTTINTPTPGAYIIKHYRATDNDAIQQAIPFNPTLKTQERRKAGGTWGAWGDPL